MARMTRSVTGAVVWALLAGLIGGCQSGSDQEATTEPPRAGAQLVKPGTSSLTVGNIQARVSAGVTWLSGQRMYQFTVVDLYGEALRAYQGWAEKAAYERAYAHYEQQVRALDRFEAPQRRAFRRLFDPDFQLDAWPDFPDREVKPDDMEWLLAGLYYPEWPLSTKVYRHVFQVNHHEGYWLTHQVIALLWLRERDYQPAAELESRLQELVARVGVEIVSSQDASPDLMAQSIALLLRAGREDLVPPPVVQDLLNRQLANGSWCNDAHTTAWALAALVGVLEDSPGKGFCPVVLSSERSPRT